MPKKVTVFDVTKRNQGLLIVLLAVALLNLALNIVEYLLW